jgi:hypothetical protein
MLIVIQRVLDVLKKFKFALRGVRKQKTPKKRPNPE